MNRPRDIAERSQSEASDPSVSAFVTASAGSGKTKLLTDRLLRLILGGARPERLLCLTFTKAAAAEMATRLNGRLGQWAVAEPAALAADLRALLGHPPTAEEITRARAAFAAVLELPGGMRIATLHAFAQSLLRSFPLEAGLPPGFSVLEEMDAAVELSTAREAELLISPALERLAALSNASGLGGLMAELRRAEPMLLAGLEALGGLPMLLAEIAQRLGVEPDADEASLRREAATPPQERDLARAAAMLALGSEKTDAPRGAAMKAWLAQDESGREALLEDWTSIFITGDGTIRKSFATRATGANQASVQSICEAEGERLLRLMTQAQAVALLHATEAALVLGLPVLKRFEAAKQRIGRLDYDDLIAAARKLLENPGSAWVLYKLDGGLDHVLLDEAQDSNPEQWGIARALTGEFFAGEGTRSGSGNTGRAAAHHLRRGRREAVHLRLPGRRCRRPAARRGRVPRGHRGGQLPLGPAGGLFPLRAAGPVTGGCRLRRRASAGRCGRGGTGAAPPRRPAGRGGARGALAAPGPRARVPSRRNGPCPIPPPARPAPMPASPPRSPRASST